MSDMGRQMFANLDEVEGEEGEEGEDEEEDEEDELLTLLALWSDPVWLSVRNCLSK